MVENHTHNKTDSPGLVFSECMENAPQEAVAEVTGTAGATYTSSERAMINNLKASLNDLIDKLQSVGILK